jgi:predicted site-specific integrase-resolvase
MHAVSSAGQGSDLDRQIARLIGWATKWEYSINGVVMEVGPALNGRRRKFLSVLRNSSVSVPTKPQAARVANCTGGKVVVADQAKEPA